MLSAELQSQILALHYGSHRTIRSIARELGISRDTVDAVIKRRSVRLEPVARSRSSILDPFKDQVLELLRKDPRITHTAVLVHLREQGYLGGLTIVRDFVNESRTIPVSKREAFLRLHFAAGECAQVDWGEFGDVFRDGTKIHCFAMVLCHSRYMTIEFTRSEKFEDFIRCHENAFRFFGGVPRECWYDNLTSAVTDRLGQLVKFNARFLAYMGHHGIRPHACNPARANEKGRVEDLIKFIRMNFWPGREFKDFEDLTRQAIVWKNQFANQRVHGSTRRVPRLHFEADEKPALLPMNQARYDTDEIFTRVVPPDFHIPYDTNRYSVPWSLTGLSVTLRVTAIDIKIYYHERLITSHPRSFAKHKVITNEKHMTGLLERKPGGSREGWQIAAVKQIGPRMSEYLDLIKSGQKSLRNELGKILALATIYGDKTVHEAIESCLHAGVVGVENLELTLRRQNPGSSTKLSPGPLNFQNQKLNRVVPIVDLRRYDALLFEADALNQSASPKESKDHGYTSDNRSESDESF
ncbi:MAG: IS21 family transposase [Bdellovibrionota bacterium]